MLFLSDAVSSFTVVFFGAISKCLELKLWDETDWNASNRKIKVSLFLEAISNSNCKHTKLPEVIYTTINLSLLPRRSKPPWWEVQTVNNSKFVLC